MVWTVWETSVGGSLDGEEDSMKIWKTVEGLVCDHGWRVDLKYEAVLGNGNIGERMILDRYVDSRLLCHRATYIPLGLLHAVPSFSDDVHFVPVMSTFCTGFLQWLSALEQ
jgi:hypothetical protein